MDATVKKPFQAVAVRYVHDVRSAEFLNVGVVMLSATWPFAGARFVPQWSRVTAAFPAADLVVLRRIARAFQQRCEEWSSEALGQQTLQPIVELSSLLRSVMIPDDASIQMSPPVTGLTSDPTRTLAELFETYAATGLAS
jgi:hypothetical protein